MQDYNHTLETIEYEVHQEVRLMIKEGMAPKEVIDTLSSPDRNYLSRMKELWEGGECEHLRLNGDVQNHQELYLELLRSAVRCASVMYG